MRVGAVTCTGRGWWRSRGIKTKTLRPKKVTFVSGVCNWYEDATAAMPAMGRIGTECSMDD
jgi:hypothetical protein